MKKESFDIIASLFAMANASCNPTDGSGTIPTKDLIDHLTRLTIIETINEKIGKLNVWDFVESDKSRSTNAVLHKDGFLSATNRRMALYIKREYAAELEGRCVDKSGKLSFSSMLESIKDMMRTNAVIHRDCGGKKIKIDFDKFAEVSKACKACKKISRGEVRPIISLDGGSVHFYYDEFIHAMQFMVDMGVDEISIIPNKDTCARIESGENVCLLMPVMGDFRQMMYVWEM